MRSLASRLASSVLSLVGVVFAVFLALRAVPGDPVDVLLGERAHAADRLRLRSAMHLDGDLLDQLYATLRELASLSLGTSYTTRGRPVAVTSLLAEEVGPTVALALAALAVALAIAIPLATVAAMHRDRGGDHLGRLVAALAVSLPVFVSGPLAIWWLAVEWPLLPTPAHEASPAAALALPALVVGFALAGRQARLLRATLLEQLTAPLGSALLARGLSRWRVLLVHLLPAALLPLLAAIGGQLGALFGGALITETVFGRRGLGTLLLEAIAARDPAVVQGVALCIAGAYVVVLALVDTAVAALDPRTTRRADEAAP